MHINKKICPGCGFQGNQYDFSPSVEIGPSDFRIFHFYNEMKGPLYCVQCKRKHLIKIANKKKLTQNQIFFLKNKVEEEKIKYTPKIIKKQT